MDFDLGLSDFLSNAPLYKKFESDKAATSPYDFQDFGISVFCEIEKATQTHNLSLHPEFAKKFWGEQPADVHSLFVRHAPDQLSFVQQYRGICQSCKKHHLELLLKVDLIRGDDNSTRMILQKLGQHPTSKIKLNSYVRKYLNDENKELYQKALMNISHGYGLGAFAYLRRVVENQLMAFLQDISLFDYPESESLAQVLASHKTKHDTSKLIESVYQFLPETLKAIGTNPFKFLYAELSSGIHESNDGDCLERAIAMDKILVFVIERISQEKNEVSEIRRLIGNSKI